MSPPTLVNPPYVTLVMIENLSKEALLRITETLHSARNVNNLAQTCRSIYETVNSILYHRHATDRPPGGGCEHHECRKKECVVGGSVCRLRRCRGYPARRRHRSPCAGGHERGLPGIRTRELPHNTDDREITVVLRSVFALDA